MDQLAQIVTICEAFGWTYEEYLNAPNWFIAVYWDKARKDRKEQELALKRSHGGK